jgi:hypothetical protein
MAVQASPGKKFARPHLNRKKEKKKKKKKKKLGVVAFQRWQEA